jgi:hypothetical protein
MPEFPALHTTAPCDVANSALHMLNLLRSHRELSALRRDFAHLASRSVALVGNAQSLLSKNQGTEIDSHAVVVRMNAGWVVSPSSQGTRTDILCLSMDMPLETVRARFGSATVVWMTPKRDLMHSSLRTPGVHFYPLRCWRGLSSELAGSRPSTGAMAVDLLRRQLGVTDLTLYGFDFKKTKTFYLDKDHAGPHRFDLEEEFVKAVVGGGRVR